MSMYGTEVFVDRDRELGGFSKLLKPETTQAIWIIEAEEWAGKTRLIDQLPDRCRAEAGSVPIVKVDLKEELRNQEARDALTLVGLVCGRLGHRECFEPLYRVIDAVAVDRGGASIAILEGLVDRIADSYDLAGLAGLAARLGVRWDELEGRTLTPKTRSLAQYCYQSGNLSALIERLETDREHALLDWREGLESLLGERSGERGVFQSWIDRIAHGEIALPDAGRDRAEAQVNAAFLACLRELAADLHPIVFLFDACEEASDETETWVRKQLLDPLVRHELDGVVVILTARKMPYRLKLEVPGVTLNTNMKGFDEERVREFFAAQGVEVDATEIPVLTRSSGGKPGMLAKMVDNYRAEADKNDPFFDE